jgi:methylamine dehydrogenase heavy chain
MTDPMSRKLWVLVLWSVCASAPAQSAPIAQAEQSDVATLKPLTPRRAFLWSGFLNPGVFIVDADKGEMEGYLPKSDWSSFAIAPGGKFYYVAETLWTHDTRGQRQDLITVYDGTTLNLQKEIPLPGRALSVPKGQSFAVSESGRYGYVFNLTPASSVVVVDLVKGKTASTVETPGCALVLPYGDAGFGSICADGSLATFGLDAKAHGTLKKSVRFFDAIQDPVFDEVALDVASRKVFFVSYLGHIYEATLGDDPQVSGAWSLQAAASLSEPKGESDEVAWRPGGSQLIAYHRASGRLFVLMHVGEGWTHKQEGAEVWVLNAATHALIRRIGLKDAAVNVAVSQDSSPLLLLTGRGPRLTVLDPDSGTVIRTVDAVNGGPVMTAAP